MHKWRKTEQERINMGLLGSTTPDGAGKQILWQPAPQEVAFVETNHQNLMRLMRRKDTGEEMWISDGVAFDSYGYK